MTYQIYESDIRDWVTNYKGELFHSILCDPPYNLDSIQKRFGKQGSTPAKFGKDGAFTRIGAGFMNQTWDTDVAFDPELWYNIGKILYPGAICMAFSGARTYHKLASAIDEAGFIIHPMLGWIQSQGSPKATPIAKQINKKLGKETALSKTWKEHKYGLQVLKPCMEPICVFQKPYEHSPLEDIVKTGAGTYWVDGNRFPTPDGRIIKNNTWDEGANPFGNGTGKSYTSKDVSTLYPTNVILHGEVGLPYDNFFYNAKASKREKDIGLDAFPDITITDGRVKTADHPKQRGKTVRKNPHPTVKPISLIEHLAKLILPPNYYTPRRLLVPFSGVGSEMIGSILAGWDLVIGVELNEKKDIIDYIQIAQARIEHWTGDGEDTM